jgi:diguanylate cyclase (GGDEF)-like protein/PAS domain S-box-containing protein
MGDTASFVSLLFGLLTPFRDSTMALSISDATHPDLPLISVNEAFCELTGYKESEVIGRNCRFLQGPGSDRAATAALRQKLEAGDLARAMLPNYRRDGSTFMNDLMVTPVSDATGRLRYFTGVQRALEPAASRPRVLRLLLRPDATLHGATSESGAWLETLPRRDLAHLAHACAFAAAGKTLLMHNVALTASDGATCEVALTDTPEVQPEGVLFTCQVKDDAGHLALLSRLRLLETVSVQAWDGIIITEAEPLYRPGPSILYANEALRRQTGHRPEDLIGKNPRLLQGPGTDPEAIASLGAALRRWEPVTTQLLNYRVDGSTFWNQLSIVLVADDTGWYTHWISVQRDVTERQEAAARITFLAEHDELTGLANRNSMQAMLASALAGARRDGVHCGAIRLDLDRFKQVNDTLGHAAGDALLAATGQRLRAVLRSGDLAIRVGGDEFLVVLPRLPNHAALDAAAARILEAVAQPLPFKGREIPVSSNVGAALFPEDAKQVDTLLAAADTALYGAQRQGRGRVDVFSPTMRAELEGRRRIAEALRHGSARQDFSIYYQPQLRVSDGCVIGLEALLRWHHPERGGLTPGLFLDVAEECGLLAPLSDLAPEHAVAAARRWLDAGVEFGCLAVNLAAPQVVRSTLAADIEALLTHHGVPADRLVVELVESVFIGANSSQVAATLRALRKAGVSIDLDDFGTGYASLTHLRAFPVDRLKLDRSFVADIGHGTNDELIVGAFVKLGHSLGLTCIAESVETEAQLAFLSRLGCDQVQDFLFARPMPEAALLAWLRGAAAEQARCCLVSTAMQA